VTEWFHKKSEGTALGLWGIDGVCMPEAQGGMQLGFLVWSLARVPEDPCFLAPLTPDAMWDEIIIRRLVVGLQGLLCQDRLNSEKYRASQGI
jgi:hypothetical protein